MKTIHSNSLTRLSSRQWSLAALLALLVVPVAPAQTFTTIKSFARSDGAAPYAALTLSGSTFYGTTYAGGSSGGSLGYGTVFKVNTDGTGYTVLKKFTGSDGKNPVAGLTLSGSTLYGTTVWGGSSDDGTVFKVNTNGTDYTVLKHFTGSDGVNPFGGLTLSGSTLYGTTDLGGSSGPVTGFGMVFKVNTDGTGYTVLKHFTGSDGRSPRAGLTLSGSTLYGTTYSGGSSLYGTVFKVNTDGTGYTVLKHFTGSDGRNPEAGLTLSGSTLYSTTYLGGTNGTNGGSLGYGTVFKVNTDGTGYTVLKHFTGSDGRNPYAGLTLSGRTLYGTTESGGSSDNGTVFKMNTDGTGYTVLKHFTGNDGKWPDAGLALSGSTLYGTTYAGGTDDGSVGYGTVFALIFAPSSNLSVQPNGVNSVKVLWPDTSSFTLQQNTDLANTNGWATSGDSITTANGTNSITITPVTGNLFFRLKQ